MSTDGTAVNVPGYDPDKPIDWDDRQYEFERARRDSYLPSTLRTSVGELLSEIERFNEQCGDYHCETCMREWLGPAAQWETKACLALRAFRGGVFSESQVQEVFALCRRYYVERVARGFPVHANEAS